jgi:uncharacterized protein
MEILKTILENIKEDAPVEDVRRGLNWTAVVSRRTGLASTVPQKFGCHHGELKGREGSYTEMSACELARHCFVDGMADASLGLAAINSLLDIDPGRYADVDGIQIAGKMGKGKNISVIGHFPNMAALAGEAANLWVIEKQPRPGDFPEEQGHVFIPQSDIVVITGTTLLNNTLPGILELCRKNSVKMLLGPSTPLSETLFEYGIDLLAGSVVTEKNVVLKSVSEGASFMKLKKNGGIRFVTIIRDYNDIVRKLA